MHTRLVNAVFTAACLIGSMAAFAQQGWRDSCLSDKGDACFTHGTILLGTGYAVQASTTSHPLDPQKLIDAGNCFRTLASSWSPYEACMRANGQTKKCIPVPNAVRTRACEACIPVPDTANKVAACEAMAGPDILKAAFPGPSPTVPADPNIYGSGPYTGGGVPGFDRGMQTTAYCGNKPESWVRGSVIFNPNSGRANIIVQLETDATDGGPKGKLHIVLEQVAGVNRADHKLSAKPVYTIDTNELGIGGKQSGFAVIISRSASVDVPLDVATKVQLVKIDAECTGTSMAFWGFITPEDVQNAFKAVGQVAASQ